jgi:hypothetical protein
VSELKAFQPVDFDLKDDGAVVVAFSRFNEIDRDADVTYPEAIASGKSIPMSDFGHTSWPARGGRLPTGKGVTRVDGDLAIFDGGFFLKTAQGANAYETVKAMGDDQEWSYGFDVKDYEPRPKNFPGAKRGLKSLDVFEVSPVLIGAGKSTGTLAIKELLGLDEDDLLVGSFTEQAERVLTALKDLHVREEDIIDLRLKEGRKISSERRARLAAQTELLRELLAGHESLLAETEPKPAEEEGTHPADGKSLNAHAAAAQIREEMVRRGYALPV